MVYLISSGNYDDYYVWGYFTDKEKAEKHCELMNSNNNSIYNDNYRVEELKNMKYYYKVRINLNGNIDSIICKPTLNWRDIDINFINEMVDNTNYLEIILFKSWNDKEQVIKICEEILKDFNNLVIERPTEDYDAICEALEIQYWEDEE